ncbi:MAG TPA: beta-galactosidase [Opitutaceae bacterium]|nr:beta-galactosidase [Opitutaceae bacterium]
MLTIPRPSAVLAAFFMTSQFATAAPLAITVREPAPPVTDGFKMGAARAPDASTLTLDSRSLLLNGKRWTPVMGEFHYTRYPASEWRAELRKMKAGGIDIVATYVFWVHHEEIQGQWKWDGDHDLRRFVRLAGEAGLKVIVRCGPWCHGEVRNGGVPDWALAKGWKVRSDDPPYLEHAKVIYAQIAAQISGLLWKEGGPVIGIQVENEYGGPAAHLLNLKRIAREAGLDVPIYTRTGWPQLQTPMPFGEIVPLYGVYAEGFWDREIVTMPGTYWAGFHFSTLRTDANIASEALGRREVKDAPDVAQYPYLTCEIGGGMMSSYHRRILVDTRDIDSTTLVKLGSGSISPGYYMYHGGTNPEGQLSTLMEQQATEITNWNDMPVKNYDFQAPLGQYGQVRPHYYSLRRLHHFLHSFGEKLADTETFLPEQRPSGKDDVTTLRWSARSDGRSGFVFVNNYERLKNLPAKEGVQFTVKLADGSAVTFPEKPVTVAAAARFIWPFNLDFARDATLAWATAQPVSISDEAGVRTVYFAETPGVPAEFCFVGAPPKMLSPGGEFVRVPSRAGGMSVRIVLLSDAQSLALNRDVATGRIGFDAPLKEAAPLRVEAEQIGRAGPARDIPLGPIKQPVAAEPTEADFAHAAVWRIKLPANLDLTAGDALLRLHYVGDVSRLSIGGKLVTDDFYNGLPLEIGLRRHAAALKQGEITFAILPLRRDAVTGEKPLILFDPSVRPDFAGQDNVARLDRVEIITR